VIFDCELRDAASCKSSSGEYRRPELGDVEADDRDEEDEEMTLMTKFWINYGY